MAVVSRVWKRSIRRFVITEKAVVGAFSVITNLQMDLRFKLSWLVSVISCNLRSAHLRKEFLRDADRKVELESQA